MLCFLEGCCYDREGLKNKEGELTHHTRTCEGGVSILMNNLSGLLYLIEKKRSCEKQSVYVSKYGEPFTLKGNKFESYYLDEKHGGL